jgi:hypothetical protein
LNLQGGNLKNGVLVLGGKQSDITLYFSASIKRKSQDANKGKIGIPLYLSEERCQGIGMGGENGNLLTEVFLDSKEGADVWVLRSTAFVVG